MSTSTVESRDGHASSTPAHTGHSKYKLSFFGALRGELLKLRSLTSSWVLMLITLLLMVGFAALFAWGVAYLAGKMKEQSQDAGAGGQINTSDLINPAVHSPTTGVPFALIIVASLAVTFIASEFGTKSVISSLTAVPRRGSLYLAKALALGLVSAVLGLISALLGWIVVQPILAQQDLTFGIGDHDFWKVILGLVLLFILTSWMGLGLGALLRNNAGAIVIIVVLLFVLDIIMSILQGIVHLDWLERISHYTPQSLTGTGTDPSANGDGNMPNYWVSLFWYAVWCIVPLVAGFFSFTQRDPK